MWVIEPRHIFEPMGIRWCCCEFGTKKDVSTPEAVMCELVVIIVAIATIFAIGITLIQHSHLTEWAASLPIFQPW